MFVFFKGQLVWLYRTKSEEVFLLAACQPFCACDSGARIPPFSQIQMDGLLGKARIYSCFMTCFWVLWSVHYGELWFYSEKVTHLPWEVYGKGNLQTEYRFNLPCSHHCNLHSFVFSGSTRDLLHSYIRYHNYKSKTTSTWAVVKFPNGFGINLKGVKDVLSIYQSSFWHTDSSYKQGCVSRKTNKKKLSQAGQGGTHFWCQL